MNMKGIKKMAKQKHREMARRLVVRAIEDYKKRFQLEVDILSGEEKRLILEEVEDIIKLSLQVLSLSAFLKLS